jgi:hypothetical protein
LLLLAVAALMALATSSNPAAAQPGETYAPSAKPRAARPGRAPAAQEGSRKDKLKEEGQGLFGDAERAEKPSSPITENAWTIIIYTFRGEDEEAQAPAALRRAQNEAGLRECYLEKRGGATVIAYGRYGTAEAGQKDLDRIHATEVEMPDGSGSLVKAKPFSEAFLSPPMDIKGSIPEYDLRNARRLKGDWAIYTLQVGVYSREDRAPTLKEIEEFRKAAEQAVVQLRHEGEQAYYYHGPMRSSVTIGLFGAEDYDPQLKLECAALKQLRRKFPYNLQNGAGVKRTLIVTDPKTGKQMRQQKLDASAVVFVPKD